MPKDTLSYIKTAFQKSILLADNSSVSNSFLQNGRLVAKEAYLVRVVRYGLHTTPRLKIPELDIGIAGACCKAIAIGMKVHTQHPACMPCKMHEVRLEHPRDTRPRERETLVSCVYQTVISLDITS